MDRFTRRCFKCEKFMENAFPFEFPHTTNKYLHDAYDSSWQGVDFYTHGNWGSQILDVEKYAKEIVICDLCMLKHSNLVKERIDDKTVKPWIPQITNGVMDRIPEGDYCYTIDKIEKDDKGLTILKTTRCPFHEIRKDKEPQDNGYCRLLNKGDWEEVGGFDLLWDGLKNCDCPKYRDYNEETSETEEN